MRGGLLWRPKSGSPVPPPRKPVKRRGRNIRGRLLCPPKKSPLRSLKKADWIGGGNKKSAGFSANGTEGGFFHPVSVCWRRSKLFFMSCPYPIGFLGGGSESTGLPVAGAAFRPQGAERVNRNKRGARQRSAAPIEVAEGGTVL